MPVEEAAVRGQAAMEGQCRRPAGRRVTVVYYLCRHGRHLEHPHLMELTLASPNHALHLRDVIHRLDDLRGKGMAAMYSWSCKRRYKTGFVWHDVTEDDVLLPAQGGSEYVLKGSLLPAGHSTTPADQEQQRVDATTVPKVQCAKPIPEEELPAPSRGSQQAGWMTDQTSPSPLPPPPLQQLQQPQQVISSSVSPSSSTSKDSDQEAARSSSSGCSSSPNKPTTKIAGSGGSTPSSSSRSTFSPSPPLSHELKKDHKPVQSSNIASAQDPAAQTDGAATGRTKDAGGRNGTLESLIRAEARVRRGGCSTTGSGRRVLLEDDDDEASSLLDNKGMHSLGTRLKPANLLMRLMACGGSAMSMSNHPGCGFMRTTTYKPQPQYVTHPLQPPPPSPVLAPLGALIARRDTTGARIVSESGGSGTCSCRWSVPQTACTEDKPGNQTPNSSLSPDRGSEKKASSQGNSENLECRNRIVPQIVRMAPSEQSRSETVVTITTDVRHNSECGNEPSSTTLSRSQSMRSDTSVAKTRSSKIVSFHDEKQKLVEVEERLASGARVIIQCKPLLKENYVRAKAM